MTAFELGYPPSLNHYYRHVGNKVLISRVGRKYRELVQARIREEGINTVSGRVKVTIQLYPPDRRRRDIDNTLKSLLDALTHAGAYEDDSCIYRLYIEKLEPLPPDGLVHITIEELC